MSFLIASLPRSRSAWLAHYLSYPLARPLQPVGHEILTNCPNVQAFLDSYKYGMWGTCETAGAPLCPIVRHEMPECRIVLIRRPIQEVYRSLSEKGVMPDLSILAEMDMNLNVVAVDPKVISIPYALLSDPGIGRFLFEYCLELEWDEKWWEFMVQQNVQVDMPKWMERLVSKRDQFFELFQDVQRRLPSETLH
jgi:hypothetical protein